MKFKKYIKDKKHPSTMHWGLLFLQFVHQRALLNVPVATCVCNATKQQPACHIILVKTSK